MNLRLKNMKPMTFGAIGRDVYAQQFSGPRPENSSIFNPRVTTESQANGYTTSLKPERLSARSSFSAAFIGEFYFQGYVDFGEICENSRYRIACRTDADIHRL